MTVEVRYYSKSGNTKKIADAIAKGAGVDAKSITEPVTGEVDVLFLGSGLYAFNIDAALKDYIKTLDPKKIKKVFVFNTTAIVKTAYGKIKELLEAQGLSVDNREYHAYGHYTFLKKNKPDEKDLNDAEAFAKDMLKEVAN